MHLWTHKTFTLALMALSCFLFVGGFCGGGGLGPDPCDSDPTGCQNASFAFDPSCNAPGGTLEIELGHGENAFTPMSPSSRPEEHFGSQGGSHVFLGVRIRNANPSHNLRLTFTETSPDGSCLNPPATWPEVIPDPIDFAQVEVGQTINRTIHIHNPGTVPLTLEHIALTDRFEDALTDFDIVEGGRDNATLPAAPIEPGQSHPLTLRYTAETTNKPRFVDLSIRYLNETGTPLNEVISVTANNAQEPPAHFCKNGSIGQQVILTPSAMKDTSDGGLEVYGLVYFDGVGRSNTTFRALVEDPCGGVGWDAVAFP